MWNRGQLVQRLAKAWSTFESHLLCGQLANLFGILIVFPGVVSGPINCKGADILQLPVFQIVNHFSLTFEGFGRFFEISLFVAFQYLSNKN